MAGPGALSRSRSPVALRNAASARRVSGALPGLIIPNRHHFPRAGALSPALESVGRIPQSRAGGSAPQPTRRGHVATGQQGRSTRVIKLRPPRLPRRIPPRHRQAVRAPWAPTDRLTSLRSYSRGRRGARPLTGNHRRFVEKCASVRTPPSVHPGFVRSNTAGSPTTTPVRILSCGFSRDWSPLDCPAALPADPRAPARRTPHAVSGAPPLPALNDASAYGHHGFRGFGPAPRTLRPCHTPWSRQARRVFPAKPAGGEVFTSARKEIVARCPPGSPRKPGETANGRN